MLDLLQHTSGLTYGFFRPFPGGGGVEQMYLDGGVNDLDISNKDLVTRISKLPLKFESGIMRGRFNERDGQLYLCGRVVWQSKGPRTGAFHRVRYTGKPVHMPRDIHVKPNGVEITFTGELDTATASDAQNYSVEQYNYRWTSNYGSKDYRPSNPSELGHDVIDIAGVRLSPDGKSVFLAVTGLKPVMQSEINLPFITADQNGPKHLNVTLSRAKLEQIVKRAQSLSL